MPPAPHRAPHRPTAAPLGHVHNNNAPAPSPAPGTGLQPPRPRFSKSCGAPRTDSGWGTRPHRPPLRALRHDPDTRSPDSLEEQMGTAAPARLDLIKNRRGWNLLALDRIGAEPPRGLQDPRSSFTPPVPTGSPSPHKQDPSGGAGGTGGKATTPREGRCFTCRDCSQTQQLQHVVLV